MIAFISGKLKHRLPASLVVECDGLGYEVFVTTPILARYSKIGMECVLWIHHRIREDAQTLYGFGTIEERQFFFQLLAINGVGPKVAMAMLSVLTIPSIVQAVVGGQTQVLVQVPGVGRKLAEKIVLELKDKVETSIFDHETGSVIERKRDIMSGLVNLGFKENQVRKSVDRVVSEFAGWDLGEQIRSVIEEVTGVKEKSKDLRVTDLF